MDHATQQAAHQAAQQMSAQNLKFSVEEAVERALRERAASTPSLEILSSPEAAQNHLNQWQKSLEETAQTVRGRTIEQANADATAVTERFSSEFDAALTGAAQKLGAQLHDVTQESVTRAEQDARNRAQALRDSLEETSRSVLSRAEQDAASKAQILRSSLDEVIAGAAATIESLGSGLQQERIRAEDSKAQLREASQSLLAQTRSETGPAGREPERSAGTRGGSGYRRARATDRAGAGAIDAEGSAAGFDRAGRETDARSWTTCSARSPI